MAWLASEFKLFGTSENQNMISSVTTNRAISLKRTLHSTAFKCTNIDMFSGCHKACTRQEEVHGDHQWFRQHQHRHWEVLLNILPFAGRKPQVSGKFNPNYCTFGVTNPTFSEGNNFMMHLSTCRPVWAWMILRRLDAVHSFIIWHSPCQAYTETCIMRCWICIEDNESLLCLNVIFVTSLFNHEHRITSGWPCQFSMDEIWFATCVFEKLSYDHCSRKFIETVWRSIGYPKHRHLG